ncbi:MAG: hypothetical protein OXF20_04590 [Gammaproteobacteria bacterium]|nr:hypothetical protein [Gammaproteobacteria bacterium]
MSRRHLEVKYFNPNNDSSVTSLTAQPSPPHIQKKALSLGLILVLCLPVIAIDHAAALGENQEIILLDEWPEIQTSANMLDLPQIREILRNFDESRGHIVQIRFPGGAEGRLWGKSVAEWLTAFGVPGNHLDVLPGSGAADRIVLEIIDSR